MKEDLERDKAFSRRLWLIRVGLSSCLSMLSDDIRHDIPVLGLELVGNVSDGFGSSLSPLLWVNLVKFGVSAPPSLRFLATFRSRSLEAEFPPLIFGFRFITLGGERVGIALLRIVVNALLVFGVRWYMSRIIDLFPLD